MTSVNRQPGLDVALGRFAEDMASAAADVLTEGTVREAAQRSYGYRSGRYSLADMEHRIADYRQQAAQMSADEGQQKKGGTSG